MHDAKIKNKQGEMLYTNIINIPEEKRVCYLSSSSSVLITFFLDLYLSALSLLDERRGGSCRKLQSRDVSLSDRRSPAGAASQLASQTHRWCDVETLARV